MVCETESNFKGDEVMSEHSCAGQASSATAESSENAIAENLAGVKHKIVVLSGKGGVGKSTVATNLAVGLAQKGFRVGLMDVDVHGPSVPHLLHLQGTTPRVDAEGLHPVPYGQNLHVISVGFLLSDDKQPVIWRGPLKTGVIQQFLRDVRWGELDYLIVDCPPGTGDEPLSVLQYIGDRTHAVVVTTPQAIAVADVRRSVSFCRSTATPILGIVENMSGYLCPHCGKVEYLFSRNGGEELAKEMGVAFLGRIPLDPRMVKAGDEGRVLIAQEEESPAVEAFRRVMMPVCSLENDASEVQQG
jgi:Mrp family chromosome partitioning ATPase